MICFNHIAPHFTASDVERTSAFYESVLGFAIDYSDGEPPHYVVVCRDEVYIHLSHARVDGAPPHPGAAFVAVAGVTELWDRVRTQPACVIAPLRQTDYGQGVRFNVFAVRDPDGNVLRIGEPVVGAGT
jgi:predicted enzyme related to lactoylglutathione lyase